VNGPVTFTLSANETAPVGGYVINSFTGASATNTVTITATSGVTITSYVGTASGTTATTRLDAVFYLNGCDFVTLDGLTIQEDAANTNVTQWMEYGIAFVAPSVTNGVQNCTIKNCNISLTRAYAATAGSQTIITKSGNVAIYVAQHPINNSTEVAPTSADGAHSFNRIINNTITNVYNGILLVGHNSATTFLPTDNQIGGVAGTGNTFNNFGGLTGATGPAHCIRVRSQLNCSISNNVIDNTASPHLGTNHLFGIFLNGGSALSTITTNNNTISLAMNGATTNTMFCIRSEQVATWTAENNIIENCVYNTATTGAFVGINIFGGYTTVNINNNKIRNTNIFSSTTGAAGVNAFGAESGTGTTLNVNNNEFTNCIFEGTGTYYIYRASGTIATAILNNNLVRDVTFPRSGTRFMLNVSAGTACNTQTNSNILKKITCPLGSSFYGVNPGTSGVCVSNNNVVDSIVNNGTLLTYLIYGFPSTSWTATGNTVSNISNTSTGVVYPIFSATAPTITIQNNTVRNISGGGNLYGINASGAATLCTISNNTITNCTNSISATTQNVAGIFLSGTNFNVIANNIRNIRNVCTTTGSISGIFISSVTTANIQRNIVDTIIQLTGTTGRVSGAWVSTAATSNIHNNLFANIEGGNQTGATTDNCSTTGLLITASTGTTNYFNNTVRLRGVLSASGASGVFMTGAATANLINNIFDVNVTTSNATRVSSILRKTAGTYASTSNNNIYMINDAPNHFYHIDGGTTFTNGFSPNATPISGVYDANFNSPCSAYKSFMAGRESSSFTETITFNGNIPTGTTRAESGGQTLAAITTDITGAARSATPDIGAYEFNATAVAGDVSSPIISYTNIPNSICNNSVPFSVTITDASGINVTAGSKPRLWFKKSTELNALANTNTSSDNGWKFVEATNSSSPFVFNVDLLLLNSLAVPGDVIQYFVAAQDNAGNIAVNAAAFFGGFCATSMNIPVAAFPIAAAPTVNSFQIIAVPTTLNAVPDKNSICISGPVTVSLTGGVASGAEYQWQSSDSPTGTFTDISGATNTTYNTTISNAAQHSNFRCVVKCGGTPLITSSVATISFSRPEIISTQGASRCGLGTLDLQATVSQNATANWYASATGGVPLGTSTTFTTPTISSTTTFFVAASEGGATSTVGRPATPLTNACGTAAVTAATDYPIRFNTTAPVTISQVTVIPNAAGTFAVALRQTLQTVNLQTATFTFTAAQVGIPQVINLGFTIATTGQYQLTNTTGGGYRIGTYSSTGACAYPMTSALGGLSIVGSATSSTSATSLTQYNIFFDFVVQEGCETPRVPVVATVVAPPAITMPANITMCNNEPAQALTVTSANAGYTYEWGPATGLNTTSGATVLAQPASTTAYRVTATDNSGGAFNTCSVSGDVTVTVNEIPLTSETRASRDTVCYSESVNFSLFNTGNAIGLTYQWQNSPTGQSGSFVNVSGATAPTLTALVDATTNNFYQCLIYCKGSVVLVSTPKQVFVSAPSIASTTPATRCGTGSVTLQATAGGPGQDIRWYSSATSTTVLGSGTTFTTPQIAATTSYFAAATQGGTISSGGRLTNPTAGSALGAFPRGVAFTATSACRINELGLLTTGLATAATIRLYNAAGTTQIGPDVIINIPVNAGTATVPVLSLFPVSIDIPAAGTYRLFVTGLSPSVAALYYEFTGVTGFPYPIGTQGNITGSVTSLTGAVSTTTYYYFYKLSFSSTCESARQSVTATVLTAPTIASSPDATICSNGTGTQLTVTSSNPNYSYDWGNGLLGNSITVNPSTNTSYIVTASDANTGCAQQDTVNVTVNQVPVSVDVAASLDTACFSENITFRLINPTPTAPTGLDYQWESSTSANGPFTPISGANSSTYTRLIDVAAEKFYRCNLTCLNTAGVISQPKEVFVSTPSITSTVGGVRCGQGTVQLSATAPSGQILSWYANATGGVAIGSGSTFTTPVINASTDFYVSAAQGSSIQPVSSGQTWNQHQSGGSFQTTLISGASMVFDALRPIKIATLDIYPSAAIGTAFTIEVRQTNATGTLIASYSGNTTVQNAGSPTVAQTVPVNFNIPTGVDYVIGFAGTNPNTWRSGSSAMPYPFVLPGVISIKNSSFGAATGGTNIYQYYFYNWRVTTGCESPRVAVSATVNTADAITVSPDVTVCSAGPASTLTVSSANTNYSYTWAPAAGLSTTTGGSVSALPVSTTTYSITAEDSNTLCVTTGSVKVTVNRTPDNPVIEAIANSTPCKTVTELKGTQSSVNVANQLGTSTNTTSVTGVTPYSSFYEGSRQQYLILASELTALNYQAGPMINLAFKVTALGAGTFAQSGFTIKMAPTNDVAFNGAYASTTAPLSTVYGPITQPLPTLGWNTYTFTSPFNWDGISNIVIDICHDNDINNSCSACYSSNSTVECTTTSFNSVFGRFNDNAQACGVNATTPITAFNTRPNMILGLSAPPTYTWSPTTGLFTDEATTTPYTGGAAEKVWAKPTVQTTYTVSAVGSNGCPTFANDSEVANADNRFVELTGLGTSQVTAISSCDDNGWTNYYINGKIFFAINWAPNGTLSPQNAIAKNGAIVKAVLDAAIAQAESANGNKLYTMKRWWNVNTSFFNNPVNVRFYYDPAEITQAMNAAGGAGPSFSWFKNNTGNFDPATMVTGNKNGIAGGATTTLTGNNGTDQGVTYVQFDGVTSFSGGTGVAQTLEAGLRVNAKVLLSNADETTGLMEDYVKTLANFPNSDPYSITPLNSSFSHVANPTVATVAPAVLNTQGNNAIVDWVFLELRVGPSGASTVTQTRAALLQKDGDIVDVDGVSPVSFFGLPQSRFVAIRHRNHSGFRTDNPISLSPTPATLNFSNNSTPVYGTFPLTQIGTSNFYSMTGGDANYDGSIDAFDTISWEIENGLFDDYSNNSDYNMDGSVDAFDSIIWEFNNGKYQELD
jgi:hypothetical protein